MLGLGNLYRGLEYSMNTIADVFTNRYKNAVKNSEIGVPEIQIVSVSNTQRVEIGDFMYSVRNVSSIPLQRRIEPWGVVIHSESYVGTLTLNQQKKIASGRAVCVYADQPHFRRKKPSNVFPMESPNRVPRELCQRYYELHQIAIHDQEEAAKQPTITIDDVLSVEF